MTADFESKVRQQIERLKNYPYAALERQVAEKRRAWFQQNHPDQRRHIPLTPRGAYEMLFMEYMGLSEGELPIVMESEAEIEWRSLNPCPTLEACKVLGLDTRQVCRAIYEKSTQALVSQLDPQLRFLRSYAEIRPHAQSCRERIVRVDFEAMMAIAIEEAKISRREGNKGYGAVITLGNRILGQAHDTDISEGDPSLHAGLHAGLHAEVNAIRRGVHALGDANLSGAILFSTCEPCPMCSSLAVWANLTTIVYGVSVQETAGMGKARILVRANEIVEQSTGMVEVIGGVLKEACRKLYV
jgi:tRNA(Arg) A34 adenosine deaminase TadA